MNVWIEVALKTLQRRQGLSSLQEPIQLLGSIPGLGQSQIVAFASPQLFATALVSPSARDTSGWIVESSIAVGITESPLRLIDLACFNFVGLWFILSMTKSPQVKMLHFRLNDGTHLEQQLQNKACMIIRDVDPVPFQVSLLGQDNLLLEEFRFPLA